MALRTRLHSLASTTHKPEVVTRVSGVSKERLAARRQAVRPITSSSSPTILGWKDLNCQGSEFYGTPNADYDPAKAVRSRWELKEAMF